MSKITLLVTKALVLVLFLSSAYYATSFYKLRQKTEHIKVSSATEQPQIDYVNAIRAAHNLPALKEDAELTAAAKAKVQDLISRRYFNHNTPEGQKFSNLVNQYRPGLTHYGENLGKCYPSLAELYKSYEASPEHLVNIVKPAYTMFGSYSQWDPTRHCLINSNEFGG